MFDITHQDVIQLSVPAQDVRQFLRDPVRMSEYYPDLEEYGNFKEGISYWCRGSAGVSLFEILEERCTDTMVSMLVTTSARVQKPYTPEAIKVAPTVSMLEDWDVIPTSNGCQITKTWLDLKSYDEDAMPLEKLIKIIPLVAMEEHKKIVTSWNKVSRF